MLAPASPAESAGPARPNGWYGKGVGGLASGPYSAGGGEAEHGIWLCGGKQLPGALREVLCGQAPFADPGAEGGAGHQSGDHAGVSAGRMAHPAGSRAASSVRGATQAGDAAVAGGSATATVGWAGAPAGGHASETAGVTVAGRHAAGSAGGEEALAGGDAGGDAGEAAGWDAPALPLTMGFGHDGVLDAMGPGPELALLLTGADGVADLTDSELTGVVRGWRRLSSWVAAMENAAVAELARRRIAEATSAGASASDGERYAAAEVAAALTLTRTSAETLVGRALCLADLPATTEALATGAIDVPRALAVAGGLLGVGDEVSRQVEAHVLGKAPRQTTGELRKALARAVIAADPAAADRRCAEAQKSARVERWAEPADTGAIAGRDLPAADVLAAGNRINALAAALKADGAAGCMDVLRARVFVGLLLGRPVAAPEEARGCAGEAGRTATTGPAGKAALAGEAFRTAAAAPAGKAGVAGEAFHAADTGCADRADPAASAGPVPGAGSAGTAGRAGQANGEVTAGCSAPPHHSAPPDHRAPPDGPAPADLHAPVDGAGWAGLSGSVHLTVPVQALLRQSRQPGEVAGFGPVSPSAAEQILAAARGSPAVRWCVTAVDEQGRTVGHGCAARAPAERDGHWSVTVTVSAIAVGDCAHLREVAGYRPPRSLRHLIEVRNNTCAFPGCGRPARQCDQDHTTPFGQGGRTCECNLAALCRYHHRVKQARGWNLDQPRPGTLRWAAPSGWTYTVTPDAYPA